MKLFLASILTLLLLSSFLIAILLALLYVLGLLSITLLFGLTILANFFLWLVGPWISDWIYRFFYKLQWISIDDLKKISPASADFLIRTCAKYNFKVPKLGLIPDKNPNAFAYGSGRWNGRIVITQGILDFLDENERMSVYAHELGHIKNRDFIIMTIAATLLQMIYEIFIVCKNAMGRSGSSGSGKKGGIGAIFIVFMIASFILYWVGQYVVLYLSRLREYYADEFSARETNANYLSSALIKIAYGIIANPSNVRLINSTKFIGIMDFKLAKNTGLVFYNCANLKNFDALNKAFLFDLKNPWGFVSELGSTHPLTGKRIRRLSTLASKPMFNFEEIERKNPVDMGRLYSNFLKDIFFVILPVLVMIGLPILYLSLFLLGLVPLYFAFLLGGTIALIGVSFILVALYKYTGKEPEETTVLDMMGDVYASPIRGKPVKLKGKLIGRGVPGLIFSEDMMMQDKTGLMFLNYESWLPVIGNLIFGLRKVPQLLNKDAEITGWFLRGVYHLVALKDLKTAQDRVRGFIKIGSLIGGFLLLALGSFLFIIFSGSLAIVNGANDCENVQIRGCGEYGLVSPYLDVYTSRDACYLHFAVANKDQALCAKIPQTRCNFGSGFNPEINPYNYEPGNTNDCHYKVAIAAKDYKICSNIDYVVLRDICYLKLAVMTGDNLICKRLSYESDQQKCYLRVQQGTA